MAFGRHAVSLALAALLVLPATGACTIYASASLGGLGSDNPNALGSCFQLQATACGKCIATQCEAPSRVGQPVSLVAQCNADAKDYIISDVQSCAKEPDIRSGSDSCSSYFSNTGGQYAASITEEGAIQNNIKLCIRDYCKGDCRVCEFTMDDCNKTTPITTSTCGKCIATESNPGGSCHDYILDSSVCNSTTRDNVETCALPTTGCTTPSCNALFNPSSGASSAIKSYSSCIKSACEAQCPP
ncbi:hypothetical protein BH09MYX1_BH09MYX1_44200 [soil metagenome]